MDQDSPGRELWHDLMERTAQVAELRSKLDIARARQRAVRAVLREQDEVMLDLLRIAASQSDAETVAALPNQSAILRHVNNAVHQLDDEDERVVRELIAAEQDLHGIEGRCYTAVESSGCGNRNEGDLSWEHCTLDGVLLPRKETLHLGRNLFAGEPVGGDITAQPQKVVRYASVAAQSYMAKLGDMHLLREQLIDFEDYHAQLVDEYRLRQECGLKETEEIRKGCEDFARQHASLVERMNQAEETLAKFVADHQKDFDLDRGLHVPPACGLLDENKRRQAAEYWRNLEAEFAAKALNFENEADTGEEEYFSSGLLQEWRQSFGKTARFRVSCSGRNEALEPPLLAQPGQWLDWPRPSRRGRGQRRNKSYRNAKKRDPCFNPFERDCLFSDADGSLSEPAIAQLDSLSDMPFCISLRYLKKIGREREMSTDLTDSNLLDVRGGKVHGIIRKMAFRVKGTSVTFRKDFFVTDMLDDLVDVVFGWSFMASEFKLLFDKASDMFSDGMTGIKDAFSGFHTKIAKVASAIRRRASVFISRTPSPSPPYSLCDVLAPNFYL